MLDLAKGMNQVSFSINSGSEFREVTAAIFLVDSLTKLVVSDIDGTITKCGICFSFFHGNRSDMMGHIFTFIGRDWNQSGVAELFSSITDNGYSIIYLTSRPIGQVRVAVFVTLIKPGQIYTRFYCVSQAKNPAREPTCDVTARPCFHVTL